jgi:hypothetical protein
MPGIAPTVITIERPFKHDVLVTTRGSGVRRSEAFRIRVRTATDGQGAACVDCKPDTFLAEVHFSN